MTQIRRGMVIDVNLDPTLGSETGKTRPCIVVTNDTYNRRVPVIQVVPVTQWSAKKNAIVTNIDIQTTPENGLSKRSIADCLQTRPIDYRKRLERVRGHLSPAKMHEIDQALQVVFGID